MQQTLSSPLSYSVRFRVIAKYLGLMLLASLGVLAVPLVMSIIWGEYTSSIRYGIIMGVFAALGLSSLKLKHPKSLQSNEAFVIISLIFIVGSLALTYPMMANGFSFIDSWFETISGVTTTGLSVLDVNSTNNRTFFFSRAWMQWYGGLGIVIFSLGLALRPGSVSKSLFQKVAGEEDLLESSKVFARKILIVYCSITFVAILVLKSIGLSFYEAVIFSFSAISTGGFSSFPDSLGSFSYAASACITAFGFVGAIAFPLFWITSFKDVKLIPKDRQLRLLIACCLILTVLMTLLFAQGGLSFLPTVLLNAVSFQTTTGFSTFDLSTLNSSTKWMSIAFMFIGGSAQSTAGGIKLIRLWIILKALHLLFFRTSLSKHGNITSLFQKTQEEAYACFILLFLYILCIFGSTLIFVIMGYDPLSSLFDVISAIGTVGVSSGITAADLPSVLKYVLMFDMLLGRLEVVALLVLFYPKTLIGRKLNL